MAICKHCGQKFTWASLDGKWIPLIPSGEEGNLPRTHVDENGELRTLHYAACDGGSRTVSIMKLAEPVLVDQLASKPTKPKQKKSV